jgi:hypothetical protein
VSTQRKWWVWGASVVTILLLLAGFTWWYFVVRSSKDDPDEILKKERLTEILLEAVHDLKTRWALGDVEDEFRKGKFKCPLEIGDPAHTNPSYLRCNPNYLQCFFSGKAGETSNFFVVKKDGKSWRVKARNLFSPLGRFGEDRRYYQIVSRALKNGEEVPPWGIMVSLFVEGHEDYSMSVVLEDVCSDTYLPQKAYPYGMANEASGLEGALLYKKKKDWIWDNLGRHIYVDKYLVSTRDVIEWIDADKGVAKEMSSWSVPPTTGWWSRPASGLTYEQMRRYCAFRGKQLLEAHIMDAATFFPQEKDVPEFFLRHPYPWTNRAKESFLAKSSKAEIVPTAKDCSHAYVKECQAIIPFEYHSNDAPSWMEIYATLGGYLEAVRNPVYPLKNLKASSFYFGASSTWHQAGRRAMWDGQDFRLSNFSWVDIGNPLEKDEPVPGQDEFKVGFRCMRFDGGVQ